MPINLDALYASLKRNNKRSLNLYESRSLSICIGFLGTPEYDVVTMTVTIIKNGLKQKAMEPVLFSKTIGKIENWLYDIKEKHDKIFDDLLFAPTAKVLPRNWYSLLVSHRVFFIPEDIMWETIGSLLSLDHLEELEDLGIRVTAFVDTDKNYMTLKL